MIKISELKMGDYVIAEFEGTRWNGEVTELNHDDKQACVLTEVQEFWYNEENLFGIPISDESLMRLNFVKETLPDGIVKYRKGSFRLVIPKENDFSIMEMWYREDRRDAPTANYIHQLQNHYLQMTK